MRLVLNSSLNYLSYFLGTDRSLFWKWQENDLPRDCASTKPLCDVCFSSTGPGLKNTKTRKLYLPTTLKRFRH
ncbi:MAG: hypothetical protein JWR84_380 [Caulobacter sp.]|nr:hypothetical protein [Caulobacter sp.]